MKRSISRREFVRLAVIAAGTTVAAACGATPTPTKVPPTATKAPAAAAPTTAPAAAAPTTAPAAAAPTATKAPAAPTAAPAAKSASTLNYAEAGDFSSFNPWRMEAVNMNMHNQSYDRLVWKNDKGQEQLGLAESWELAKDALSAKVAVRQGAKWSDGKEHRCPGLR